VAKHLVAWIFAVQAALFLGWFAFSITQRFARKLLPSVSSRTWVTIAFIVFFSSLLAGAIGVGEGWRSSRITVNPTASFATEVGKRQVFTFNRSPSEKITPLKIAGPIRPVPRRAVAFSVNQLLIVLYLLFAAFLFGRALLEAVRLCQLLGNAPRLRSVGRISIVAVDGAATPFSFSLFRRSFVALPGALLSNPQDIRIALAHEIEHVRARHTRVAILGEFLACTLMPVAPLWKTAFVELHELSCDEAVIGRARISSHEYANCLIRVAETALNQAFLGEGALHAGTACMATDSGNPKRLKSFLRRRMEMLTEHGKVPSRPGLNVVLGSLTVLICGSLAFSAGAMLKPAEIPAVNSGTAGVDPVYQAIARRQLENAIDAQKANSGIAIVANPQTGEILASVIVNSKGYSKLHPEFRSAVSRLIEPASTMKGIVLAAALERGDVKLEDRMDCGNGTYRIGSHVHHDWKKFDSLSAADVVVESSNIGGIRIGEKMGGNALESALENFGFGAGSSAKTFPGARPGVFAVKTDDPEWIAGASTGFGIYVSPLELVQAYSAIANGGRLMKPIPPQTDAVPELIRRVLSETTAKKMRGVLARAAVEGTGSGRGASAFYSSGGKTGTSYHPDLQEHDEMFGGDENVAHYVGFAPLENPQITVYVAIIVDPKNSNIHGSAHAAPVFKEIMERSLVQMHVKPDSLAAQ
jgi:Zn-dependent protease with chaperone function